jgi:cyclopropane-fatty-acyl-phospholipid synthase
MTAADKRLDALKRFLAHVHERLKLDFGLVLWEGSTVPADLAPDALALVIADEGAIAGLIRRPNLDTLANLWVSARLDVRHGTLFDLVARRPKMRTKESLRAVDRWPALATAARFLLVPRGGPWPLEAAPLPADKTSDGSAAENTRNIQYHYDVSNAFYSLFLGPDMAYSSAHFADWNDDLATAQRNKLDMVCRKLRLKSGDTLLDIGCGWGSLLFHAARNYGVRGTGVTLSRQQHSYVQEKAEKLGLADMVKAELRDYATVDGAFDKVNQIEMVEHIGLANHPTYYQTVHRVLKPDGLFHHQAISRPAKRTDKAFLKRRADRAALTKYVLPGGEFDHIGMTLTNLERYGFEVHDVEDLREHHARTCRLYHDAIWANRAEAEREAGPVTMRLWLAYFAACSIAFERNTVAVYQTLASKRRRGPSGLPPTRADLYR